VNPQIRIDLVDLAHGILLPNQPRVILDSPVEQQTGR
jgi:hypothetical protein